MNRLSSMTIGLFLVSASAAVAQDAGNADQGNGNMVQGSGNIIQGNGNAEQGSGGGGAQGSGNAVQGSGGGGAQDSGNAVQGSGSVVQGGGNAEQNTGNVAMSGGDIAQGKRCFDEFTSQAANYDPKYLNMISDDARITYTFISPDGTTKDQGVSADQYKEARITVLPQQKASGNMLSYSGVDVKPEGSGYRVSGTVHYSATGGSEQFSGLVNIDENQKCHIVQIRQTFHIPPGMANRIPTN